MSHLEVSQPLTARDELTIVYRQIGELKPYTGNARTHSERQIRQLIKSIKEFGFVNAIIIDQNGRIVAGYGRFLAAKRLGMERVPTVMIEGLSDRTRGAKFIPVGVIQGITAADYVTAVYDYCDMGYDYIALGGLVPKSDPEVKSIVESVATALNRSNSRPWLHLFGIYRPLLQELFKQLGISSFDSATYFRKAWLRSDQNYLANDGNWYAAIRVPPTSDPRTLMRLKESGLQERDIKLLEKQAMSSLRKFARRAIGLERCIEDVLAYDALLERAEDYERSAAQYRKTLESRPWEKCGCTVCMNIGINSLIFRGLNRNKRRGAHNTLQLFTSITQGSQC